MNIKNDITIHENELVYSTLRNELIVIEEMQRNMYIYMYSIFAVLYAVGVQFGNIFFLLTYIVLIPFQCKIDLYNWSITKMSIYIRVFFEEKRNDIHWESLQTYPLLMREEKYKKGTIAGILSQYDTALLGCLAMISFIVMELKKLFSYSENTIIISCSKESLIISCCLIIISVVLAFYTIVITKQSFPKKDIEAFNIIERYKNDLESGHLPSEYRIN